MEIFMRKIGYTVTNVQLKSELAGIFHGPEYSSSNSLLNFEVRILPRRKGLGILTVPTEEVGLCFLRDYGEPSPSKTVIVLGTQIKFTASRSKPNRGELERIRRMPYIDPAVLQEQGTQSASSVISVRTLQFGWECREGVFSVEWEQSLSQAHLEFSEDRREFRLRVYNGLTVRHIGIPINRIFWSSSSIEHDGTPVIFISLNNPPSFELEHLPPDDLSSLFEMASLFSHAIRPRDRLIAFDQTHSSVVPYTSIAIRLVCNTPRDVGSFRRASQTAGTHPTDFCYPIEHRGLFSAANRQACVDWISRLEWNVAFQVTALIRSRSIDLAELLELRTIIEQTIAQHGAALTAAFLRDFAGKAKATVWYGEESSGSTDSISSLFTQSLRNFRPTAVMTTPSQLSAETFDCYHATVTPTTVYLEGPFPERPNRIIRRYAGFHDNFLRVNFVDEADLQYRLDREVDGRTFIHKRVKGILLRGLEIAGQTFMFLAYSQSALKEHAVWFMRPFDHPTDGRVDSRSIIAGLGTFHGLPTDPKLTLCPARYAARVSQAFTATDASASVQVEEVHELDDTLDSEGRSFTDGVGTISTQLARDMWTELCAKKRRIPNVRTYPRVYQVRFKGSKGMLSVDYQLPGRVLCLRRSMIKFDAPQPLVIEVARAFDKPTKYFLNRPLIMILDCLGVPYEVFHSLQKSAVTEAQNAVSSLERSARLLEAYGLGGSHRLTSTMLSLHKLGVGPLEKDVFWQEMMDFAVNHVLRELKHHARIPVPEGWTLVGVADVHGYLQEGEIFACVDSPDKPAPIYLEGRILISRSPTIHPGDVQIVRAIGRPPPGSPFEHESLRNSVVFSIKGQRPLASCLGGGDLDGDVYNLTTVPELLPRVTQQPARYPPARRKELSRASTMDDVAEFIADYMNNDTLGMIAISWLVIADQSNLGIMDPDCLNLAGLHSIAVDYPKTGTPVGVHQIPRYKRRELPDWNAPEVITRARRSNYYKSQRAIGRLFRAIDLPAVQHAPAAAQTEDEEPLSLADISRRFYIQGPRHHQRLYLLLRSHVSEYVTIQRYAADAITRVWDLFQSYASQLRAICVDHTLSRTRGAMLTEAEAVVGTIVANSSQPRKRTDRMSHMREQTAILINGIRAQICGDGDRPAQWSLEQAWLAYKLGVIGGESFGARSFAWVAQGEIFDAIKTIEEERA